jgi:uncharacterized protein YceK
MLRVTWRRVGCLALILAFTAGGCASLEERTSGREAPPIDTASGKGNGGGGGY